MVVGASGAGKTTAVRCLASRGARGFACYHFDSIGVPTSAELARANSTPEAWQQWATREWMERLQVNAEPGTVSVLEGQTRPSFLLPVPDDGPLLAIVLIECSADVRTERLRNRGQPELATRQMDMLAAYLRGQADALGLPVIDSTRLNPEDVASALEAIAENLVAGVGSYHAQQCAAADHGKRGH